MLRTERRAPVPLPGCRLLARGRRRAWRSCGGLAGRCGSDPLVEAPGLPSPDEPHVVRNLEVGLRYQPWVTWRRRSTTGTSPFFLRMETPLCGWCSGRDAVAAQFRCTDVVGQACNGGKPIDALARPARCVELEEPPVVGHGDQAFGAARFSPHQREDYVGVPIPDCLNLRSVAVTCQRHSRSNCATELLTRFDEFICGRDGRGGQVRVLDDCIGLHPFPAWRRRLGTGFDDDRRRGQRAA